MRSCSASWPCLKRQPRNEPALYSRHEQHVRQNHVPLLHRYRVILAQVPFVDVVTTMLDASIPLTTNEYDEWGNPEQKSYYDYMLSYSPYDNLKAQAYPAMFVGTGLWDSQVQYFEPAKYVARLRDLNTSTLPVLFRTNMDAGHGGKSGRFRRYRELSEMYAFLLGQLAVPEAAAAQ